MGLQSLGRASGAVTAAIAAGMLCGFMAGFPMHLPFLPPWSCVVFLIAGVVLWSEGRLRLLSAAVLIIGLVTLAEDLTGSNTGFDRLLFSRLLLAEAAHPGRPAALTSFHFLLIGSALFLLKARHSVTRIIRDICAVTAFTLAYLAFLQYLRAGNSYDAMSPLAALLSALVAVGILTLAPEGPLLALLRDPGPAGILARRLMPVPVLLTLATAMIRITLEHWGRYSDRIAGAALGTVNVLAAIGIIWGCCSRILRYDRMHRQAEEELRNQQANVLLASILQASPLAICAFNLDGTVRRANAAAEAWMLGSHSRCRQLVAQVARGEAVTAAEIDIPAPDRNIYLHVWASPLLSPDGGLDGVVVTAADVSERKALEAQIQQTQRLESLGVLAGGIAHDFNNLLTGVMGHASMLADSIAPGSPEAGSVRALMDAAERMAALTAQMLAYSGKGRFFIEPLDLSHQVSQIVELIRASIPKHVELRLNLGPSLPAIEADASQVQQIVMNLVINAAEAVAAAHGQVVVRTELRKVDAAELEASVTQPPPPAGDYIVLMVSDNGAGMDEATRARIFEPFFTTKFAGRGLGLSAVLGIVRSHDGAVTVDSQPGVGTTFRVFFPLSRSGMRPKDDVLAAQSRSR